MKKVLVILLSLVMIFTFAACGGSGSSGGGDEASGETYELRLATHYNTEHAGYAAIEKAVAAIEEQTGGAVKISVYPSSQLGDYTVTYQDLGSGAVDLALIPCPSEYDPRIEMNFVPYMFSDYSQLAKAFGPDSYFFENYVPIHAEQGVEYMGAYVEGLIGIGFTTLPDGYGDPNVKKNLKIRCPAIEVYNLVTEDLGFNAVTIPYADLYTSMQTGVCDGWIGGTPQLNYSDFKDIIKYYVPYNVFAENIGFFMSAKTAEKLPAEYADIIRDVFAQASLESFETAEALDAEALQGLKDYGVEIVELTDEEMAACVKKVQEVTWPKLYANIGEDVLKGLVEALNS